MPDKHGFLLLIMYRNKMVLRHHIKFNNMIFSCQVIEHIKTGSNLYSYEECAKALCPQFKSIFLIWKWKFEDFIEDQNIYSHLESIYKSNKNECEFIIQHKDQSNVIVDYLNRKMNGTFN